MAVKYVKDFTFAPSPPRPTIQGYARGGHVSTPQTYAKGGLAKGAGITNDRGHTSTAGRDKLGKAQGDGKVSYHAKGGLITKKAGLSNDAGHIGKDGDDSVARKGAGDGDVKRSSVGKVSGSRGEKLDVGGTKDKVVKKAQGGSAQCYAVGGKVAVKNSGANNPNDAVSPGSFKRTPPSQSATNAKAAKSNFDGGKRNTPVATKQNGNVERMSGYSDFKKGGSTNRLANLGHYAHGGKVGAKAEKAAGTPKTSPGSHTEKSSGTAKMSMGGLSRATSPKKNAAIHAKSHKPKAPHKSAKMGPPMGGALSAMAPPPPDMGAAPPMGGPPPSGPPMGAGPAGPPPGPPQGAPPMMASGGGVKHVIVHHISHK